jgi:hypothetical protein
MCGVIELLFLEPTQIAHRPALFGRIAAAMLEHEGAHLLPVDPQRLDRGCSGANEISHRFVVFIGNPHPRWLAGA